MTDIIEGACLCGRIRLRITGPLPAAVACHCTQCRRQSGHYWASTEVARDALAVEGAEHVGWYAASPDVRRGFCTGCGSFLFWDPLGKPTISVAMGALANPTGVRLERHIFVDDKGDYYDIGDGLPQNGQ